MSKVVTTFAADDQGMVATINKIERETKSMKDTTQKAEKSVNLSFMSMAKAGAGLAVGIGVIKGAFSLLSGTLDKFGQALDMGGRLSDLSARTGETAGNLLLLERAFDNSGAGADKVGSTINRLQKFMSDAENDTKRNIKVLNQLGVSYDMLSQMSPAEQMRIIAERISEISTPTERAAAAMAIFGKSGGALLPLLQNFSAEISNAQDELGSMTRVMDAKNAVFDTISDKIEIIKGKFTEFSAGLLSRVTPALELFTTALSRVDAAAIGEKLANAFLGGQKAMEGFGSALNALKIGEFGLSWKMTFKSIELQVFETINQINLYIRSTVSGIKSFILSLLGPNSAIINILDATFAAIAAKAGKTLIHAIGGLIPGIAEKVKGSLEVMNSRINLSKVEIQSALQDLTPQLVDAGQAFGSSFDETFNKTKPLIDTLGTQFELNALNTEAAIKSANEAAKDLEQSLGFKNFGKGAPNPLKPMEGSAAGIRMAMRKAGDDLKGIVDKVKELSEIEKLTMELEAKKSGKGIEPIKKEFQQQLEQGKFKQAERTIKKIQDKELEDELRIIEKGRRDRRNIADIAKKEGVNTFGKTQDEIRKEILEKRREKKGEIRKIEGQEGNVLGDAKQPEKKADPLLEMVKAIKELVAKIEPKLPTHALAL